MSCVAPIVLIFQRFWQALAAHPEGRRGLGRACCDQAQAKGKLI
jgi:hypothetical protein